MIRNVARIALLAVASLAIVLGVRIAVQPSGHDLTPRTPSRAAAPAPSVVDHEQSATEPLVTPVGDAVPAPVRVQVPALGIDSGLERLHAAADGQLRAPSQWQRAGWFADGTRPGDVGPAVIAGHVDSPTGPAVFARLSEIRPGELVIVTQHGGATSSFRVDRTALVRKKTFPTRQVYGPTPDAQLRLITCDGPYVDSAGGYQDNLVVFASEVPS